MIAQTILDALGCPKAELSIVVTDDATIQAMNAEWRSKDKPTDVLSFSQVESLSSGHRGTVFPSHGYQGPLGDVVISADTAAGQAARFGNDFEAEIRRLLVHGVLHLLGHDHVHGGRQAARMRAEEERLLQAVRASLDVSA